MSPSVVPTEFMDAAIEEITGAGYYRTDPAIEFQVEGDTISFISTSKIIPFNGTAKIAPPRAGAAKGLKLVDQTYQIDGKVVEIEEAVKNESADYYCVKFKRKNSAVKEVSDLHHWVSPVTAFKVTFKHSQTHKCGVDMLTGRSIGLTSQQTGKGCIVYNYPCASFSGQGFRWWVKWQ